jgi:hypothetical protein
VLGTRILLVKRVKKREERRALRAKVRNKKKNSRKGGRVIRGDSCPLSTIGSLSMDELHKTKQRKQNKSKQSKGGKLP